MRDDLALAASPRLRPILVVGRSGDSPLAIPQRGLATAQARPIRIRPGAHP